MAARPVVIIGLGEMGGVFARGLLKLGHPVYPVTRDSKVKKIARMLPDPKLVLLAVGEKDLGSTLQAVPRSWCDRLVLLQNELLPNDFRQIDHVTVISVWFEKKKGQDAKVIIPSPVYGPRAKLLARALATLDIPVRVLEKKRDLLFELVVKNLYILTTNIAGLRTGGTVSELWSQHQTMARSVAEEIIALQEALTDTRFDHEALIAGMVRAFHGDPQHKCMGRSAPARLERALANAERLGIDTPSLDDIAAEQARVTH